MENQNLIKINLNDETIKPTIAKGGRFNNPLMQIEDSWNKEGIAELLDSLEKEDMTRNYTTRSVWEGMKLGGTVNQSKQNGK